MVTGGGSKAPAHSHHGIGNVAEGTDTGAEDRAVVVLVRSEARGQRPCAIVAESLLPGVVIIRDLSATPLVHKNMGGVGRRTEAVGHRAGPLYVRCHLVIAAGG